VSEALVSTTADFASLILQADDDIKKHDYSTYATLAKPETAHKPIEDPGRVAYVAEFSDLSLFIHDYQMQSGEVHYPLPKTGNSSIRVLSELNELELKILHQRGALDLPPRELCDELVDAYFKWVAPIVPMINRTRFMRQYHDLEHPPSMLLMQAILLAGSRVCTAKMLMDSNGSPLPAATLFYKRAKALYDADYEQDRVTLVQALILMGWYWEEPGKVTKNVFYWNGVATAIAQGFGMHRDPGTSQLSTADKKLWRRIWWTLFTRDRSVAVALGRPPQINLLECDVEMIHEDDFLEDNCEPPDSVHLQFFIQYVKVCQIMDRVLLQNYSVSACNRQVNPMALVECDQALDEWLHNCPVEVVWHPSRYNFWSAYLYCIYETTICLLHRAHLPPVPSLDASESLLRSPAFQSANAITSVIESLISHGELRYSPPFM
jgi:hypothetical protein